MNFRYSHAFVGFQGEHATNQSYTKSLVVVTQRGESYVQSVLVLNLVHGSSLNISPERYLQNSRLRSVG